MVGECRVVELSSFGSFPMLLYSVYIMAHPATLLLFFPSSSILFPLYHTPPLRSPTPTTCLAEFPHHSPSNPRIIQCRLRWSAKGEMLPGMCSPPHSYYSPDTAEAEYNICCSCANQSDHFFRIDHNTFPYKRSTRTPPELTILTIVFPFILHPIAGPTLLNRWVSYAS